MSLSIPSQGQSLPCHNIPRLLLLLLQILPSSVVLQLDTQHLFFFMKEASAFNSTTLSFSSTTFCQIEDWDLEKFDLVLFLNEWSLLCSFSSSFSQLCTLCLKENTFWSLASSQILLVYSYLLKLFMNIHQHLEHVIQLSQLLCNSDAILIRIHQIIIFTGLSEDPGQQLSTIVLKSRQAVFSSLLPQFRLSFFP